MGAVPKRMTVLWYVGDLLEDSDPEASYVTDVVRRSQKPKRGSIVVGIAPVQQPAHFPTMAVQALGRVGAPQKNATGKDRVRLDPWIRIEPVPFDRIADLLPRRHRQRLEHAGLPAALRPVSLTPALGAAVLEALRQISSDSSDWLASLDDATQVVTGTRGYRLREERDALTLAFEFAGIAPPEEELARSLEADASVGLATAIDSYFLFDTEDDLLTVDLRRFDGRGELPLQRASVARYERDGVAITVANVNKKPLESVLGVDLVYWDEINSVFTLLQYKRLTRNSRTDATRTPWAYRNRREVQRQLDLMKLPRQRRRTSRDWRLSPSPFWFKFVRADAFQQSDPKLLRGMYVPADFLTVALADGSLSDGPRGGFQIHHGNTRYVTRDVFVELIKRGLIGTTTSGTRRVLELINSLAQTDEVVLAIRSAANHGDPASGPTR